MSKLFSKSDLPTETQKLINDGKVTYRGCGMGKNYDKTKIRVNKKEYMIENTLFAELGGINKMRFYAPPKKG